eukprot:scaffold1200_cov236-Isochrysis_galbana.AAC.7
MPAEPSSASCGVAAPAAGVVHCRAGLGVDDTHALNQGPETRRSHAPHDDDDARPAELPVAPVEARGAAGSSRVGPAVAVTAGGLLRCRSNKRVMSVRRPHPTNIGANTGLPPAPLPAPAPSVKQARGRSTASGAALPAPWRAGAAAATAAESGNGASCTIRSSVTSVGDPWPFISPLGDTWSACACAEAREWARSWKAENGPALRFCRDHSWS